MTDIRRAFEQQGFYHASGVFSVERLAELEREFDWIVDRLRDSEEPIDATWSGPGTADVARPGDSVLHTHNVQQYSAVWLRALLDEGFTRLCRELLGPDVVLHHTKLFLKPARSGSPFPLHQDWTYFPTERDTMIAGVIHVSEATDEMGCLRVVPGSHRLGRVEGSSGQGSSEALGQYSLADAVPIEAHPGDVVFFHYFTLHGSMPNRSSRARKTVLVQLYGGDDRVESPGEHPDERLVLCGRNRRATRSTAGTNKQDVSNGSNA